MALTWEVCRQRTASGGLSIADNKVDTKEERSWSVNYLVVAQGITDPFDVSEISAMRAPGVPQLRYNVYVDPDGTVFPYFSCKNKTCDRNPENPYMFTVSCEYTDDSGSEGEQVQPDPESYLPSIKFTVKGRKRVSWADVEGKPYILPTGSKYKQPLMLDYPCLTATVVQFENTFSTTALKARMLKTNTTVWNVMAAETALITDIKYEEVQVPVGVGYIQGYQLAYKVTYTIEENDLVLRSGKGTAASVNTDEHIDMEINWEVPRPQIDSLVKNPATGFVQSAVGINPKLNSVYLCTEAGQEGRYWNGPDKASFPTAAPPLVKYKIYENASFNFLRI